MITAVQPTPPSRPTWLRPAAWAVALITTIIILFWGFNRAPQNAFDDAYITYRYADNLRLGLGLLYNPGEWVFGTTTPLFTFILAGLGLVVSDLEFLGHWLGVLFWLTSALLTIPLLRQENRLYAALIAPLLIALQPTFYTSLGMETPLLVALMLALALFWLRGSSKVAVVLAALLIMTRHDSALWLFLIGLEVARRRHQSGQPWLQSLPWREGLAAFLLTLPWFIFAWLRYGNPLPNSAAAKIGQNNLMPVEGQLPFALALVDSFFNRLPPLTLIFLIFLFIMASYLIIRRQRRFWWLLAWPLLYAFFYTIVNVANFPWYFVPPITMLLLVIALALGTLLGDDHWQIRPSTSILISPLIWRTVAVLGLMFFLTNLAVITADRRESAGYRPSYLTAARWLRDNTSPEATVATIEIGVIGYHSRRPILDTQGLVSRDMTNHQLGWDDTLVYALNAHQPDYALALPGTAWDIVTAQWWFQESYEPVERFAEATLYGRITPNEQPNPSQNPTTININTPFQAGINLKTLTLDTTELQPGQYLTATLAISVTESSPPPLHLTTYLVDTASFLRYAVTDIAPFENLYPSQHWQAGDQLHIPLRLMVPADLPQGAYNFGLILNDTAAGIPLLQENQNSEIHLGLLRFGPPQAVALNNQPALLVEQQWSNGITLGRFSYPTTPIPPGSLVQLQMQWDTTSQIGRDWTYFIHIINAQDEIVAQIDQRPWNGRWPTTAWRPNEPFRDNVALVLPTGLPAGNYSFRIGFYILDERLPLINNSGDFLLLPDLLTIEP